MHTALVVLFVASAVIAGGVLALFAGSALWAWATGRRAEAKKEAALRKKFGRRQPWLVVPEYALPAPGAARAIAAGAQYRLRGIERSRGIRRHRVHVFVSDDPKIYRPSA